MFSRTVLLVLVFAVLSTVRVAFLTPKNDTQSNIKNNYDKGKDAKIFPQINFLLNQRVSSLYPSPESELVRGVVLGIADLEAGLKRNLINTGTIHIVVVSGFNITLVGSALLSLRTLIGKKAALSASLVGIVLYTLLTGAQPPTIRAAVMGSLAFLATGLGRPKAGLDLLILAAGLMLVVEPSLISDLSFQLSFLATLGVILFSTRLVGHLGRLGPLKEDLANTIAAQSLVTPLLFFHFGQISYISVLVNMLVLWMIPIITVLGFISLALSFVVFDLGQLLAWGNLVFLRLFLLAIEIFKVIPPLAAPQDNLLLVGGFYLLVVGISMLKFKRKVVSHA